MDGETRDRVLIQSSTIVTELLRKCFNYDKYCNATNVQLPTINGAVWVRSHHKLHYLADDDQVRVQFCYRFSMQNVGQRSKAVMLLPTTAIRLGVINRLVGKIYIEF